MCLFYNLYFIISLNYCARPNTAATVFREFATIGKSNSMKTLASDWPYFMGNSSDIYKESTSSSIASCRWSMTLYTKPDGSHGIFTQHSAKFICCHNQSPSCKTFTTSGRASLSRHIIAIRARSSFLKTMSSRHLDNIVDCLI